MFSDYNCFFELELLRREEAIEILQDVGEFLELECNWPNGFELLKVVLSYYLLVKK